MKHLGSLGQAVATTKDDEIFKISLNILQLQGVPKNVRFRHPVPLSHDNLKFIYETRDKKISMLLQDKKETSYYFK